ncbi:MAG: hypothetical protein ACO307_16645, partial [Ilumatobacteraceae bacterium]
MSRFGFEIDGSVFAETMAARSAEALRRGGRLPAGATVEPSVFHRDTTGVGELWVGADGLPVRQSVSLTYPEQDGEVVTAEIVVDFFGFAAGGSAWSFVWSDDAVRWVLVVAGVAGGGWLFARFVGRRGVPRRSVAFGLAVSFLASVIVVSSDSVAASGVPVRRGPVPVPVERIDSRDVVDAMSSVSMAPNVSPLASVSPVDEFDGPDDGTDTDSDGLSDFVERRIGTLIDEPDTDGDGIPDPIEVMGFALDGKEWFGDPLRPDTNNDSIPDSAEWDADQDGTPDDRDRDGVPDVWDDDNDGDGVPDHMDSSPFARVDTQWSEATPFEFRITGADRLGTSTVDAGLPLFVDFQLRPPSQDHLQFALRPLDWPSDTLGQIRDVNDGADDLKLVPMLEITLPSAGHLLPTSEKLASYSVSVFDLDDGARAVYVPLTVITDDRTGARVAFSGRMPYLTQAEWGAAHEVRLVWMVQVANDVV